MATFREADQVRLALKMKLHFHAWYKSSTVVPDNDGYSVIVGVKHLDNQVRKIISPVLNGVAIKVDTE